MIFNIPYGTGGFPWELLARIIFAAFCGVLMGMERHRSGETAGVRTHTVLAIAACTFMLTSLYGFWDYTDKGALGLGGYDPSMIAHQAVNGVAFMGAGLIFKCKRNGITGLETASGLWLMVGIGLACGGGLYLPALLATLLATYVQRYLKFRAPFTFQKVEITFEDGPSARRLLERTRRKWRAEIVHTHRKQLHLYTDGAKITAARSL